MSKLPRWCVISGLIAAGTTVLATQLLAQQVPAPAPPAPQRIRAPSLSAPAVVEPASRVIELRSELQGRLSVVNARSGDQVKKGQVLAELNNAVERANVKLRAAELARAQAILDRVEAGAREELREQARCELRRTDASLEASRIELGRVETLTQRGVRAQYALDVAQAEFKVGQAQRDRAQARVAELLAGERPEVVAEAQAEVQRAGAALELAVAQLSRTRIVSPLDGICVYRFKEPGEIVGRVSEQIPVMSVADAGSRRLRADVDASDLDRVRVGQQITATAPAFPGQTFTGCVVKLEQTLGRKNFRTDRPREKVDTKVLEVVIELDGKGELPLGLETTVIFMSEAK